MKLPNKVAIVTGGDTGIGEAISVAFAREGAKVVIDYHGDASVADALVSSIARGGGTACAFGADVAKLEDVRRLVSHAVETYGALDVMVNNAGVEHKQPFLEMPFDVFNEVVSVNLGGTWLCSQAAAQVMVRQKTGGRIVNISSVHEELAMPTNAPYCASKGAIKMLARTLAVELAPYGITVNDICPGAVDTPMDRKLKADPAEHEALLREIPLRRMARPDEIAELAVYLASDAAAYVTGASFVIDGGMTKQSGSL